MKNNEFNFFAYFNIDLKHQKFLVVSAFKYKNKYHIYFMLPLRFGS